MKKFYLFLALLSMMLGFLCLSCQLDAKTATCKIDYITEHGDCPSTIEVDAGTILNAAQLPTLYEKGYIFKGWFDGATEAVPGVYTVKKNVTFIAKWETRSDISYKVTLYKEELDGTYIPAKSTAEIGSTNAKINIDKNYYPGFEYNHFESNSDGYILADGSSYINVYYNRKRITLTFDLNGGNAPDELLDGKTLTGKFGADVQISKPTRDRYEFDKWEPELPETFPENNNSYKAIWKNAKIPCTVKYYVDGDLRDTDDYDDLPADYPEGLKKDYIGYEFDRIEVSEDKTEYKFYYNRKTISLRIDLNGGDTSTELNDGCYLKGLYEASVKIADPTREGYVFDGWKPSLPETFPAESPSTTYTATWKQSVSYKVNHWLMNLENFEYTLMETETCNGFAGEYTEAKEKDGPGFKLNDSVSQKVITTDGKTEIDIYYLREFVKLSIDLAGGKSVSIDDGTYESLYGAPVEIRNPVKEGYTFLGWEPALPETMPAESEETYKALWEAHLISYKVNHYWQIQGNFEFTLHETDDNYFGYVGDYTEAKANDYPGMDVNGTVEQKIIAADGSTEVNIYYIKVSQTLKIDLDGGKSGNVYDGTYSAYYGSEVIIYEPRKEGYTFFGWEPPLPETMPLTSETTYKAIWVAQGVYVVKHYQENKLVDTETMDEIPADYAAVFYKKYPGWEGAGISVPIHGYEYSVNYVRKTITLSFDLNGGSTATELDAGRLSGKYGKEIVIQEPVRNGYAFAGWVPALPETYPAEEGSYTATWKRIATYKINHYWENIDDDGYSLHATYINSDVAGNLTQATVLDYEGFTTKGIENQKVIAEDDSTEVNIYYTRNYISLNIDLDGGETGTGLQNGKLIGKYGAAVAIDIPTKDKYIFSNWDPILPETFPAESPDTVYTAQWIEASEYVINHYLGDKLVATDTTDELPASIPEGISLNYPGWELFDCNISSDGKNISIYYRRKTISLNIDLAGGSTTTTLTDGKLSGPYEAEVSIADPTKEGFRFAGWNPELPETLPAESPDTVYIAQWNKIVYTISYYKDNVFQESITVDELPENFPEGLYKEYTGYEPTGAVQSDIDTYSINYVRKTISLRIDLNNGSTSTDLVDGKLSGFYGTDVCIEEPTRDGFAFAGWVPELPDTFPADSPATTFTATWKQAVSYIVKHYQQNLVGNAYTLYETETDKTGYAGDTTEAEALDFEGYELAGEIQQKTITTDGHTEVTIYYNRKIVSLKFNLDGGTTGTELNNGVLSGRFGAPVEIENPVKKGYRFMGWDPELPSSYDVSDNNKTYYAIYIENPPYLISYHLEGISSPETELLDELPDNYVETLKKEYTGYDFSSVRENHESRTIDFYYDLKIITLTLDLNGGSTTTGLISNRLLVGKYGETVDVNNPTREGFAFNGWIPELPETFPENPASYTATWKQYYTYTVEEYIQSGVDPESGEPVYRLNDTETKTGFAGDPTKTNPAAMSGLTLLEVEEKTITTDGKTVVRVYYNLNTTSICIDLDGGSTAANIVDGKLYGLFTTDVVVEEPSRTGYRFAGWQPPLPAKFPRVDSTETHTAQWIAVATYKVNHYIQNTDLETYTLDSTETKSGDVGSKTVFEALERTGFVMTLGTTQKTIAADGSTEINAYYNRKSVTLTLELNGGETTTDLRDGCYLDGHYGVPVQITEPTKTGYRFTGWTPELPEAFPEENMTICANWTGTTVNYNVWHQRENLDGTVTTERETRSGTSGEETNAVANEYEGFTAGAIVQRTIMGDGSTVVSIRYSRVETTVTFDLAGGKIDDSTVSVTRTGLYEAEIEIDEPTREGYRFTGWSPSIEDGFPAESTTYIAQWALVTVNYKVIHKVSQIGYPDDYEEEEIETLAGYPGDYTTAAAKEDFPGFTLHGEVVQQVINIDGSTEVLILYDRNTVRLTFDLAGGTCSTFPDTNYWEYEYEDWLDNVDDPVRPGYRFDGWSPRIPRWCPAEDTTYTAQWTQLPTPGITVNFPTSNSPDVGLQYEATDEGFAFTAIDSFASYKWMVNGRVVSGATSNTYTFAKAERTPGSYVITVIVVKDGKSYTAKANVVIEG